MQYEYNIITIGLFRIIDSAYGRVFLLTRKYTLRNPIVNGGKMETRIALIGIIVEDTNAVENVNEILHNYGSYIIGRMGIPYREKQVNIISIVIDAPNDVISSLSGKLGMIKGISVKTVYSKK